MLDVMDILWVSGHNSNGCLGIGHNERRVQPVINKFFDNKRIIDFACGDKFSIVIAEVYELTLEEEIELLVTSG